MTTAMDYWKRAYELLFRPNEEEFWHWAKLASGKSIPTLRTSNAAEVYETLERISQRYGFALDLDYPLLYAWQPCFGERVDDDALMASLCVVLYGILADLVLDSVRFSEEEKTAVCRILRENTLACDEVSVVDDAFPELRLLRSVAESYFSSRSATEAYSLSELRQDWTDACISEEYVYRRQLRNMIGVEGDELPLLCDKSVKFEKVAFLTATLSHNTQESVRIAQKLGEIIWLVDDICDFVEDIREHRMNSLLVYCAPAPAPAFLTERVEAVVENLGKATAKVQDNIAAVRTMVDDGMYGALYGADLAVVRKTPQNDSGDGLRIDMPSREKAPGGPGSSRFFNKPRIEWHRP